MTYQKPPTIPVGDEHIDNHHDELFNLDGLLERIKSQKRDSLETVILYLEKDVLTHFDEEEAFMAKKEYTKLNEHQKAHEEFRKQIHEIRTNYDTNKPAAHIIFTIKRHIDRLIQHILTLDTDMAKKVNT